MKDILKYIVPYFLLIIVIFLSSKVEVLNSNVILPLSYVICTVYYLRIDNPHKTFLNQFSLSLILCFIAGLTPSFGWSPLILKVFIAITALIYLLRFMKREERLWIDYLKVILVLTGASLIIIIPEALPAISAAFGFIYILDRFIIRRHMKKTTQIIVFSFLALVCITFVIFGQIKANEAYKNAEAAKAAQEEAMQIADMARQQAEDAATEAIRQQAMLVQVQAELAQCKGD